MKIKNTTQSPNIEWLLGGNPNAIEVQEAQGQQQLVESQQLPSKWDSYSEDSEVRVQYSKMGIKVIGKTENDDLFLDVELPEGWKIEPTDHSMWSHLVDNKGRTRASIFYKAAFYGRDAFIDFNTRFKVSYTIKEYLKGGSDTYEKYNNEVYFGEIKDSNKTVFKTKESSFKEKYSKDNHRSWWSGFENLKDNLRKEAEDWLIKDYPDYKNINAYWD